VSEPLGPQSQIFRAKHRGAPIAPDKVRPAANLIRRRGVPEALQLLGALKQRGAAMLRKVVQTAVANAQDNNADLDADDFHVFEVRVDGGPERPPLRKRYRLRAYGRVNRIRRRTSHITVSIATKEKE